MSKPTLPLASVIVIALATSSASAEMITVYFIAHVPENHVGPLVNGAEVRGYYTYESTSAPTRLTATLGEYLDAITEFRVEFPFASARTTGSSGSITIFNDTFNPSLGYFIDSHSVSLAPTDPIVFENPSNPIGDPRTLYAVSVSLDEWNEDAPPTALNTRLLTTDVPTIELFNTFRYLGVSVLREDGASGGFALPLSYLSTTPIPIPEPSSTLLLLVALGGAMVFRTRRRSGCG